jgi:UDPglucose 6-dehydrogenase
MIGFIGLSHLGIVSGIATAAKGFDVLGFDLDAARCAGLGEGIFPVSEPGLFELFQANRTRLRFSAEAADLSKCDVVFYSLDVPTDESNRSNLEPLRELLALTAPHLSPSAVAVILCQVPPGFTGSLAASGPALGGALYYQVETLIFGNAVERALQPERYIVGCSNPQAPLPAAYTNWLQAFGCPVLPMRYESAELAKISINMFLVSSVATTNTLAEICERVGADWSEIAPALRLDRRIGSHAYLSPGLGLAGGNLERDLVTVQTLAAEHGTEAGIVAAWQRNSVYRRDWVLRKIHELVLSKSENPTLAIWGLAYKPDTHSIKNSPALALIEALAPFPIAAFDPQVRLDAARYPHLQQAATSLEACRGAAALVVMTPWREFSQIAPSQIKSALQGTILIDPFGALNRSACMECGLSYHRLGMSA